MNIFALDNDPKLAARFHVDKHVVKMPAESLMMLNCTLTIVGAAKGQKGTWKPTQAYKNHPCTQWVRESLSNFLWLRQLAWELTLEGHHRYGKVWSYVNTLPKLPTPDLEDKGLTPFALAMPDHLKSDDAVQSYRSYYLESKTDMMRWKLRPAPAWVPSPIIGVGSYTRRAATPFVLSQTVESTPDDRGTWPAAFRRAAS